MSILAFQPHHIECLGQISASHLAKHVRHLTVNTEILPALKREMWSEAVLSTVTDHILGLTEPGIHEVRDLQIPEVVKERILEHEELDGNAPDLLALIFSNDELEDGWEIFRFFARPQKQWDVSEYPEMLRNAIKQLRNLRRVDLVDPRGTRWHNSQAQLNKRPFSDALASCSPWKGTLIDPDDYYHVLVENWNLAGDALGFEHSNSAYPVYLLATALTLRHREIGVTPITELNMDVGHHVPLATVLEDTTSLSNADELLEDVIQREAFGFFDCLSSVSLSAASPQFDQGEEVWEELVDGLRKARNLRSMTLDLRQESAFILDDTLLCVLKKSPWPQLGHLHCSGLITPFGLVKLATVNAKSLRRLELVEVELIDPERWDDVLEKLRSALQLDHARVSRLVFGDGQASVMFFDAKSGEKSPLTRRVEQYLIGSVDDLPGQDTWDYTKGHPRFSGPAYSSGELVIGGTGSIGMDNSEAETTDTGDSLDFADQDTE